MAHQGQEHVGMNGVLLDIDLTSGAIGRYTVPPDWYRLFLGGKALAARILLQELAAGVDPLAPANLMVFTIGTLTGSGTPCSARYNLSTKSPLTGGIASSNCGGTGGIYLRRAGFDGLILRGRAARPTVIEIVDEQVTLREAGELWGLETQLVAQRLGGKQHATLCIGPAGEHLVRFANIMDGHRTLGRAGVGAVLGSKLVKAITIKGSGTIAAARPERLKAAIKRWTAALQAHPITGGQLPRYGTAGLTNLCNATWTLATRNFSTGHDSRADQVSGETMAETILARNDGCRFCPIRCARRITLDGVEQKGVEFETLGMFGPNIDNWDQEVIARLGRRCDELGLDTISAGSTLAFAMELTAKGLLRSDLAFGRTDHLPGLLEDIAHRRGLGAELAEGSLRLAQQHGGLDYAMQVKGLELAAYEPRGAVGHGLGYATANRGGCHINGGYLVFFEALGPLQIDPLTHRGKAALVVFQQNVFEAIAASGTCIFTSYAVLPGGTERLISLHGRAAKLINVALQRSGLLLGLQGRMPAWLLPFQLPLIPHSAAISEMLGRSLSLGQFVLAGERGYTVERLFNLREGFTAADDSLPARLTDEPQRPDRPDSRVPLACMLPEYYATRGWDPAGVPRERLLRRLGLRELLPLVAELRARTPGPRPRQDDAALARHLSEQPSA